MYFCSSQSYSGDRGDRRACRTRQPQWRCGEQKTAPAVLPQPRGELGQVPEFTEVNAQLEQAMLVKRQTGTPMRQPRVGTEGRGALDGEIIPTACRSRRVPRTSS